MKRSMRNISKHSYRNLIIAVSILGCIFSAASAQPSKNRQLTQPEQSSTSIPQARVALIIGNSDYHYAPHLENPANDAEDMAKVLRGLGFEIVGDHAHLNQSADKMKEIISVFGEKLRATKGIGVFYFAGHGVQAEGHNYLIPVEAKILREPMLDAEAVDVNRVLSEMESAGNALNIVILDACRSNPFGRRWRSSDNGLAAIPAPGGTLIAYATSPGSLSDDGTGRNGLYTSQLLKIIPLRGLNVLDVFQRVRISVRKISGGRQIPWEATSLTENFYFAGSTDNNFVARDPNQPEIDFWDSIKTSTNGEDFRRYLNEYPKGQYAPLARKNLRRIEDTVTLKSASTNSGNTSISAEIVEKASALRSSGDAHRMNGQNDLAIKDFTEALRLNPNDALSYALRALSFEANGKLDLALVDLIEAIRIDNTSYWYFLLRGEVYSTKREYEMAVSDLSEAIRLSPKEYRCYDKRAEVYEAMGRRDLASADRERRLYDANEAIRNTPNSPTAYLERCYLYVTRSKLDLALEDCKQSIRLDPKNGFAHAMKGEVYQAKGDYSLAIAKFNEAIQMDSAAYWSYWAFERRAAAYRAVGLIKLAELDEVKARELKARK